MERDRSIRLRSHETVPEPGRHAPPSPKPEQLPGPPSPHQDKDGLHEGGDHADAIDVCRH
jgi:hypothetical protein